MDRQENFVICNCRHCDGKIEFDAAALETGEARQVVCPHCDSETEITVPTEIPPVIDYFADFIGQSQAKERLKKLLADARPENGFISNLLICSPHGFGKTELSAVLAKALHGKFHTKIHYVESSKINSVKEFLEFFTSLNGGEIILLDDIDQLDKKLFQGLKQIMIDSKICVEGIWLNLPTFKIIATITDKKKLPAVLLICFTEIIELQPYTKEEMSQISLAFAKHSGLEIEPEALSEFNEFNNPMHTGNAIEFIRIFMRARNLGNIITLGIIHSVSQAIPTKTEEVENVREVISSEVKREVWRRDEGKCTDCGSRERLEYDHIIPISKGGSNTVRNIQLLCEPCNRQKSAQIQ